MKNWEYDVLLSRWCVWFEDCVVVAEGQLPTAPSGWEALLLRVLEVWCSDLCRDADFLPEVSTPEKNAASGFRGSVEALWTSVPQLRQLIAYSLQLIHQPFCHSMILKSEKITAFLNSCYSRSRLEMYSSYSGECI